MSNMNFTAEKWAVASLEKTSADVCSEGDFAGTDVWRQCSCSEVHVSYHVLGPRKGEHAQ